MKLDRISLQRVHHMPKVLEPGILYVSEEFGAAAHLCACGCGVKASAQKLLMQSAKLHAGYRESNHNNAYPHRPQIIDDGPYILPTGWCWTTLASVLTHMVDCVNDTPNFSDIDTGLLGLKTTNIRPYRLDLQRRWYMSPDDFVLWNRRQSPQAGDIVLTREAPVGNVCMIPEGIRTASPGPFLHRTAHHARGMDARRAGTPA